MIKRNITQNILDALTSLPRLLAVIASRVPSLLNFSEFSRTLAIPQSTLKRYMTLLEATFLIQHLPAWSGNIGKRLVKSSKLVMNDTGLMAHLLGAGKERLLRVESWDPCSKISLSWN